MTTMSDLIVEKDDIWEWYKKGFSVVVPTNGALASTGKATMGRGIALQALKSFGKIDSALGNLIRQHGNNVFYLEKQRLIMFPTKPHWKGEASLELIKQSCEQLKKLMSFKRSIKVAMPKVGCGNGKLKWKTVKPIIQSFFADVDIAQFRIVDNDQGDSIQNRGKNREGYIDDLAEKESQIIMEDQLTGKKYNRAQFEEWLAEEKRKAQSE
jgi:hypothetical protein